MGEASVRLFKIVSLVDPSRVFWNGENVEKLVCIKGEDEDSEIDTAVRLTLIVNVPSLLFFDTQKDYGETAPCPKRLALFIRNPEISSRPTWYPKRNPATCFRSRIVTNTNGRLIVDDHFDDVALSVRRLARTRKELHGQYSLNRRELTEKKVCCC